MSDFRYRMTPRAVVQMAHAKLNRGRVASVDEIHRESQKYFPKMTRKTVETIVEQIHQSAGPPSPTPSPEG